MAQKNGRAAHISNFNHNDDDVKLRGPGFGVPDESSREPGADYQETSSEEEDSDDEVNESIDETAALFKFVNFDDDGKPT